MRTAPAGKASARDDHNHARIGRETLWRGNSHQPQGEQAVDAKNYIMQGRARERKLDIYHLILAPTHACNLNCRHCYLPDHNAALMPLENVLRLMEDWSEIVRRDRGPAQGIFHLKGGEPLILPYLPEILSSLADRATLRFMMTTNGTLYSQRLVDSLAGLKHALSDQVIIIVSLDGSCEQIHARLRGPGSFDPATRLARGLADASVNVHLNYVVHRDNINDVPAFVELAEHMGVSQVNFLAFVPRGNSAHLGSVARPDPEALHRTLTKLYREGDQRRRHLLAGNYAHILDLEQRGIHTSCECVAGYQGLFYVTPEGDVYSCPNLVLQGLRLGNVFTEPLLEIHERRVKELHALRLRAPQIDERYMCRGERLVLGSGSVDQPVDCSSHAAYPIAAQHLQGALLSEGKATLTTGQGVSYCFSRNF